jgi:acylaminoacyl-peptidase
LPSKIKARIPSPSGNKLAVLVEENVPALENKGSESKRHAFEIWTDGGHRLAKRVVLPKEKHGPVCTDFEWFGGISWSPDETTLVYNAEVPSPKAASFFDTSKSTEDAAVGSQYTLGVGKSETWGEKYMSTALLGLFCINVETGKIGAIKNVPMIHDPLSTDGGYVLGQAQFSPCGKSVIYTGWDAGGGGEMPRRLGAIYCFQRPCKIYSSPVSKLLLRLSHGQDDVDDETEDDSFDCITSTSRLARSPRFSRILDGRAKLAFLCNEKGFDTHGGCMALHVADWNISEGSVVTGSQKIVVDIISLPGESNQCDEVISGIQFPGLWFNQLPHQCFSDDLHQIITTSEWGCTTKVISISLEDGSVVPINFDLFGDREEKREPSQRFLCFSEDGGVIVAQSEANRPTMMGYLQPDFISSPKSFHSSHVVASMAPISCTSSGSAMPSYTPGTGYSYQIMNVEPSHGEVKVQVGSILLLPEKAHNEKVPLIVVPHGGPHTCMPTSFERAGLSYGFLCKQGGYAILHVNFRGSTGFGQSALQSLAGKAGSLDVLDVVAATHAAIKMGRIDPDRVGVCGGSHG